MKRRSSDLTGQLIEDLILKIYARSTVYEKVADALSVMLATVELRPTEHGTTLLFTHQAVFLEAADGPEMRKYGWNKLLDSLAKELANA